MMAICYIPFKVWVGHFCPPLTISFLVRADYRITPKGVLSLSRSGCKFLRLPLVGISAFKSIRENFLQLDYASWSPRLLSQPLNLYAHQPPIVPVGSNDEAGALSTTLQSTVRQSPSPRSVSPATSSHTPIKA